jgi:pyruvate dehydrogenase E2 component (dihydrolipoamide acetyltransferase)
MGKHWEPLEKYSSWRKISVGMWRGPDDPTIYGFETLDVSRLIPYLDEVSRVSGVKVNVAAFCANAASMVLEAYPDLNVIMVGKKLQRRKTVDIFCQVAVPDENSGHADLSGVKLHNADKMDLVEVARRLSSRADKVRKGQDEEMEQTKATVNVVPGWLMRPMLKLVDFLTYNVPINLGWMGVRDDPFGSAMVSSVGPFDIKLGFAPLVPASRVPMVFLPGVIHKGVVVNEDDEMEVRDVMMCSCTFDHRCFDGYQIGHVVRLFRDIVQHPLKHCPPPEHWAKPADSQQNAEQASDRDADESDAPAQPLRPEEHETKPVPAE